MAELELLITAKNQATAQLEQANKDVTRFLGDVDRSTGAFTRSTDTLNLSLSQTARAARAAAIPLAQELSPALGQTASQLLSVATTAAVVGGGITGLIVAGAGLAGVFGGRLIEAYQKVRQEQLDFDRAIRAGGMQALGEQARKATDEITELRAELEKVNAEIARRQTQAGRIPGIPTIGPQIQAGQLGQRRDVLQGRLDTLAEILSAEGLDKQNVERILSERRQGFAGTDRAAQLQRSQAGLLDALLDPIERTLAQMEREARELENPLQPSDPTAPRVPGQPGAAARIRGAMPALRADLERRRDEPLLQQGMAGEVAAAEALISENEAELRALAELNDRTRADQERTQQEFIAGWVAVAESHIAETERELAAELAMSNAAVGNRQRALDALLQVNHAERERIDILGQVGGLSLSERENLDSLLGAERERLQILEAQLNLRRLQADPDTSLDALQAAQIRIDNARLQGGISAQNRTRDQLERTDFGAGAGRGLRDLLDDFRSEGREGEQLVRNLAGNMERAFSDLLFSPLEKNWKRALQDVPEQFLRSTFRNLTDVAGRFFTGQLVEGFSKAFPALGLSGMLVAGTGAIPGTATAAQLAQAGAGQVQSAAQALTGSPLTSLANRPITGEVVNLTTQQAGDLFLGGGTTAVIPSTGGGLTAGAAIGGVTAAIGLGFQVARSLQGPPPDDAAQILGSIGSGATSGLVLGATIGSVVPGIGTAIGAFVGALAGAFIGGGAAAGAKGQDPELSVQRQQARQRQARAILDECFAVINRSGDTATALRTTIQSSLVLASGNPLPQPFDPTPGDAGGPGPSDSPGIGGGDAPGTGGNTF